MATTTTSLNDLLPSIIQEALYVASEQSIMRGLVKNYTLGPAQGKTINVPIYPLQTAATLTEGTAIEIGGTGYANVATDTATLTIGEVGLGTHISDLARISSASNVVADVGRLFGEAIARKIDLDLTAKFANFTTNVVGSANILAISATITAADIFKAVAKLRSAGVPSTDLACVLHPRVAYDLKANLTNTYANPNAGTVQNTAMLSGYVGTIAGVPIYETSNLADNGTSDDFVGGLFHRDALGFGLMRDISIETQREPFMRGDSLVATALYATGVVYEGYGVAMAFDSTI